YHRGVSVGLGLGALAWTDIIKCCCPGASLHERLDLDLYPGIRRAGPVAHVHFTLCSSPLAQYRKKRQGEGRMGAHTSIEWCHHSFSAWSGCQRVSPGCDHCYAETLSRRFPAAFGAWGNVTHRKRASDASWEAVRRWNRRAALAGERRRVFPSMCDVFDNQA